jgi:hypothetical protein
MRQKLSVTLLILVSLMGLSGSWLVLTDWMNTIEAGFHQRHYLETALEFSALATYAYLGVRFFRSRLAHL